MEFGIARRRSLLLRLAFANYQSRIEAEEMAETLSAEIKAQAQRALASSPVFDLRALQVDVVDGSLLLSGRVETFYHKQLAQEAVRQFAAGVRLVNEVAVEYA
jgi:osmotically-inducible protein OsmY